MTNIERKNALSELLDQHARDPEILHPMESRLRWLSDAVPLLSFSPTLHQNAQATADVLAQPNFSSDMYERMESRILLLVRQGVTELTHGLTPAGFTDEKKPEEHTLLAYWQKADLSQRIGMLGVFGLIFVVGFLCGKIGFFGRLYDLVKEIVP